MRTSKIQKLSEICIDFFIIKPITISYHEFNNLSDKFYP